MVALYFTHFPKEAENYYEEVIRYEEKLRIQEEEEAKELEKHLRKLSKTELLQTLLDVLKEAPERVSESLLAEFQNKTNGYKRNKL